jgi:YegS/Rv2252/BmrU family lipid kinase
VQLIVNPASAGGRLGREWPRLQARLQGLGIDCPAVFTEAPWHAVELAEQAVCSGSEPLVAVGGDGTACETAMGLHRAGGGTMALLPLGTGNDTARTLGVPLGFDDAARVLRDGEPRAIDLIRVGDYLVPNAIGIGLTADISARAARIKWIRGIVVYLVTAVASMFRFPSPTIRLRTPDRSYEGGMTMLAVHNGPTSGGGFKLTPRAIPDDGLLDATLVPGIGPFGRLPRLVAAMRGTLGRMAGTLELQAPWLELDFDHPLPVHIDGNVTVLEPPTARFELLPEAIRVLVPKSD